MPRRKKRAAWASLTQVDATTWRIRFWSNGPDGYKRRSKTIRNATRKDAERARSELMLAHSEDAPCPTVGEVWERWALPAYVRRFEGGEFSTYTLRQYKSGWNHHAAPRWGDIPCDQVKPLAIQQWLDGMSRNGATNAMNVLRPTMDYAVRYGAISTNPFREKYLMPSKGTIEKQDRGIWTLDELGELWRDRAYGQWWEAPFLLSAFGGCRVGESLGVMASDVTLVDVDGVPVCQIRIDRQMPSVGTEPLERLKNQQSRRTIAVPGRAGLRLAAIADECDGWLGGSGVGRPSTQRRLMLAWKGSGGEHPFRNLRNSYETNMRWTIKLPPWIVEPLIGHAAKDVTGQFYDRPSAEMFANAVAEAYRERPYDAKWDWVS